MRIYINRNEDRVTFKIKGGYFFKLLMPETLKLLGSTEKKVTKDENDKHVPQVEITEIIVRCNVVNNNYQQIQ